MLQTQSHESLIKAKRVANHEATKRMEISGDEEEDQHYTILLLERNRNDLILTRKS